MAVEGIGSGGAGQVPADVRALLAEVSLTQARALAATLSAGEILSARVGPDLGNGNVALTVRGQTLVANSQTPLVPNSLVQLLVQSTGDQPVLRLLAGDGADVVALSTTATRAVTLGLPVSAAASAALEAFEQAGAPLDPVRLKAAAEQLQSLPPAQVPQRATALALLAQTGLPVTPAFIALAERSASGTLPNPAAAIIALREAVLTSGRVTAAAGAQPALADQPVIGAGLPISRQAPAASAQAPASSVQPPASTSPSPAAVGQPPTSSQLPAFANPSPPVSRPLPLEDTPAPPPSPAPVPTKVPPPPLAPVVPPAPPANAAPATPAATPPVASAPMAPAVAAPVPAPSAAVTVLPAPPPAVPPLAVTLGTTPLPDLARGGAAAVLQALALAGVRPRDTGELPTPRLESTLLDLIAVPVEAAEALRSNTESPMRQPLPWGVEAAIANVMREQAAETVVKPQALIDYDLVMGLPLQVNGQPLPARLAVAERQTTAGTATFLRVDAELTHLGPLSVRISGIENGPMAITVLAAGPALVELAAAMPELNESLRSLGLTVGLRLADLAEDHAHG